MMKRVLVLVFVVAASSSAFAVCEKWKSEIGEAAINLGFYISAYAKLKAGNISREAFIEKADKLAGELEKIKGRAASAHSCPGDQRFERRRVALVATLDMVIPVIRYGSYLAPERKAELERCIE